MKKLLKSLFLKIKAKSTLKTYQKPLIVTIFKLLFINLIVLVIVAIIALTIDNNGKYFGGNFFKAFITAVKWMISVNSINNYDDNDDLKIMILAVAVIAIGMILLSGAIIATLTAAIRVYIDKKSKAELIHAFYYGSEKSCMLLGWIKNGNIEYLAKCMDNEMDIKLNKNDSLIYIKY
ncbi:MAG: hypothetical protein IJP63_04940 [Acholeplasmatales bacterium]|nr:hypothetical protein [Acholeplasmatales bacterium]